MLLKIGTLLSIVVIISQIDHSHSSTINYALNKLNGISSQWDGKFISRAINLHVSKTFLESFANISVPLAGDDDDVGHGRRLYTEMQRGDFREIGSSNVFFDLPVNKINSLVNIWKDERLITSDEAENMANIVAETGFKTIIEHAVLRGDGVIVYGITGFVEMATSHEESRRISVPYSFRAFRVPSAEAVTYERNGVATGGQCRLWNQFCSATFHVNGLSDDDSQDLFTFMRSETMKQFIDETGQYREFIGKLNGLYESYLPDDYKESLKKIEENPHTSPSDLFAEYPFDMNTFLAEK